MAGKKLLSGNGWSFEPAGGGGKPAIASAPPDKQKAKISLEKRAKGKEVTVIAGFVLSDADRKALAATLKKACGSGGTDAGDSIEIQGDHRGTAAKILAGLGWNVRPPKAF